MKNSESYPLEVKQVLDQQIQRLPVAYQKLFERNDISTPRAVKKAIFIAIGAMAESTKDYSVEIEQLQQLYEYFDFLEHGEEL
jgi:hypothetical protein